MATNQASITQAIAQAAVEATKAAAQAMAVAVSEGRSGTRRHLTRTGPRIGGPTFRQPKFS